MKMHFRFIAILLAFAFASISQAQIFYNNSIPGHFFSSYTTPDEIADDTPFTGTQHVGSFSFIYTNPNSGPVSATARFYSVDATTGGPGALLAAVPITNLPPGVNQVTAVNIPAAQQFDWVASPGIYHLQAVTGGFFSLQFNATNCGWFESDGPTSLDGFYDHTTNQFITFNGDPQASFVLQISNSGRFPALAINLDVPTIFGSQFDAATITVYPPPAANLTLKLFSSKPAAASVPATVTIGPGTSTVRVPVTTKTVKTDTLVSLAVQNGTTTKIAKLTVTAK